jgi:L-ascorbate metabolism protein UlaG (beta-lactamase superfamily)
LGDLGHTLSAERAAELAEVDVLMIPVGGVSTIDAAGVAETVRLLEPKLVIPMHFKTEALNFKLDPIENFMKEMGVQADLRPEPRLVVNKSNLPLEMQVVVMNYRLV